MLHFFAKKMERDGVVGLLGILYVVERDGILGRGLAAFCMLGRGFAAIWCVCLLDVNLGMHISVFIKKI